MRHARGRPAGDLPCRHTPDYRITEGIESTGLGLVRGGLTPLTERGASPATLSATPDNNPARRLFRDPYAARL